MLTKMDRSFMPSSIQHYNGPTSHEVFTTKEFISNPTLIDDDSEDENFPFVLSLPSITTTNSERHIVKPNTVGRHRRVIKKYRLQPRYKSKNNANNKDFIASGNKSPSPIKMKEPSVRVLLSGYNSSIKKHGDEESMTMMATCTINNVDDDNHIDIPSLCYSPPRRRGVLNSNNNSNEKVLSDDLPNIRFLAPRGRRPASSPTSQEDGYVTPTGKDIPYVKLPGSSLPFLPTLS